MAALGEWSQLRVVVRAQMASEGPGFLDPPLPFRREGRTAPIRRFGDQRRSGFTIDDRHVRAPIPIGLVVLLATQSLLGRSLAYRPSALDRPRGRGTFSLWQLDLLDLIPCEQRTPTLFPLERSERRVRPVPLKVRMAVGCSGNFPLSGVGGWGLRRRHGDDAGRCCPENGEK
jgi:hypothetical protein